MFYPFMTLNDMTEITHSAPIEKNGKEEVQIYIERPCHNGFQSASCFLPSYRWEDIEGFSKKDIATYQEIIESEADVIICSHSQRRSNSRRHKNLDYKVWRLHYSK